MQQIFIEYPLYRCYRSYVHFSRHWGHSVYNRQKALPSWRLHLKGRTDNKIQITREWGEPQTGKQ